MFVVWLDTMWTDSLLQLAKIGNRADCLDWINININININIKFNLRRNAHLLTQPRGASHSKRAFNL